MTERADAEDTRLPRGRHQLTREDVATSQHHRLCWAAVEVVAERGYRPTTVADIIKRAQVSRRTFYEVFDNKDDCFAAAFGFAIAAVEEQLTARVDELTESRKPRWQDLVRTSLETYLKILAAVPTAAHALHIETLAAGAALERQRAHMQSVFADRMRRAHRLATEQGDPLPDVPDGVFDLLIGGIDSLVRECLRTRGPDALPDLAPTLYLTTVALLGRPEYPPAGG